MSAPFFIEGPSSDVIDEAASLARAWAIYVADPPATVDDDDYSAKQYALWSQQYSLESLESAQDAQASAEIAQAGHVLDSHLDVTISAPSNGQTLVYDGAQWVNFAVAPGGGLPAGGVARQMAVKTGAIDYAAEWSSEISELFVNANLATPAVRVVQAGAGDALDVSGNLHFTGNGRRIRGSMSSLAPDRLVFQTADTDSWTLLTAAPSGSNNTSALQLFSRSSMADCSYANLVCTNSVVQLDASRDGTGPLVPIQFVTGGAVRMQIGATGGVFIFAPTTGDALTMDGNLAFLGRGRRITGDLSTNTLPDRLMFQTSVPNAETSLSVVPSGTGARADLTAWSGSDVNNAVYGQLYATPSGVVLFSHKTGVAPFAPLSFVTGGLERMRITPAGEVLIGIVSPLFAAGLPGTTHIAAGGTTPLGLRNTATAAGKCWKVGPDAANQFLIFNQNDTGVFLPDGGTAWIAISDERMKDIFGPITDAIAKVRGLRAVIGKFKSDDEGKRHPFLIAQDVQRVLPEAVVEGPDGMLGLAYTEVIPLLVAAINELATRLETRT